MRKGSERGNKKVRKRREENKKRVCRWGEQEEVVRLEFHSCFFALFLFAFFMPFQKWARTAARLSSECEWCIVEVGAVALALGDPVYVRDFMAKSRADIRLVFQYID